MSRKKKFFLNETIASYGDGLIREALERAVIFDISNVDVPDDMGFEDYIDLPIPAPYPETFFFFEQGEGKYGALVLQVKENGEWSIMIQPFRFYGEGRVVAFSAIQIIDLDKDGVGSPRMGFQRNGGLIEDFKGDIFDVGAISDLPGPEELLDPNTPIDRVAQITNQFIFISVLKHIFFALALLNTKNVIAVDSYAGKKYKKGGRNRHKGTRHYTLRVRPSGRKSASGNHSTGIKHAFHIARGHFKTYTAENPLFGKHVGTYWWESYARGVKDHGQITKDYEVHSPKETDDE